MNRWGAVAALVSLFVAEGWCMAKASPSENEPVDWVRVRKVFKIWQRGAQGSSADEAYMDRIWGRIKPKPTKSTGFKPLTELGTGRYRGEEGGLYGRGHNDPPRAHRAAALRAARRIRPLDDAGKPSQDGTIVLLSIGMSNSSMEFIRFKSMADADSAKVRSLIIVNGAQGGVDSVAWSRTSAKAWRVAEERLGEAGVSPDQVQAVWVKLAAMNPLIMLGEFPAHAQALSRHYAAVLAQAQQRYPNLRLAFLSSRIYAGYTADFLNPEPCAYESGFAVRWTILRQIRGAKSLNHDASRGAVKAPVAMWGPYLWADGMRPRKGDGLIWRREDLAKDGTHPSSEGERKVAELLLTFFKTNPASRGWFLSPD